MAKSYGKHKELPPATPLATWFLRLGFVSLALIILLFTPYTNNLDDIKVTLQYWLGPALVCLYLFLYSQGHVRPIPKIPFYCIAGYMAIMIVSTALSQYPWLGFSQFGFQFSLLGFFLVMAGTMVNRKNLHNAVWFFVLMGFATSLFGVFHYFGGFIFLEKEFITTRNQNAPMSQLIYTLARTRDMLSTILNRDFFASFLVFLYPLAISAFIVTERTKARIFIAITAVMMFFCFYLGVSKDSFGAFGISILAYVLLYWKFCRYKKLNIPHWWVWALGLALWMGTIIFMTWDYFSKILHNIDTGIQSRSIIWGGGLGIWLDTPKNILLGGGPGHFRVLFPQHRAPDYFLHEISNVTLFAHNRYIDLLAEEGILGFVLYMALIAAIFWYSFIVLVKCKDGDQRVFQLGVLSALLGLLLANIFSPNVRWTVVAVNFWAVMGLGIGNYEFWKNGDIEPSKQRRHIPITPSLAALMAVCGIFTLWNWYYGYVYFAGAYNNNEGVKLMTTVEKLPNLPPQDKQRLLLRAIDHFNTATDYNPTFLTSYYKVAHCYNQLAALNAGEPQEHLRFQQESLKAYNELSKYAKDYAEIHFNLGIVNNIVHSATGDEKSKAVSLEEFKEAARQSNKIVVQYRLADSYLQNDQVDEAIEVFKRIETLPLNPKSDEAEKDLPYKERAPYVLLELYLKKQDFTAAENQAMKLYEQNPGDVMVIRQMIALFSRMQAPEKAIDFLERVLETNPANVLARTELARVMDEAGDVDGAIAQLEMALFFDPDNIGVKNRLQTMKSRQNS